MPKSAKSSKPASFAQQVLAAAKGHYQLPFTLKGNRITLDVSIGNMVDSLPEGALEDSTSPELRKKPAAKAPRTDKVKAQAGKAETAKAKASTPKGGTDDHMRKAVIRRLAKIDEGLRSTELELETLDSTDKRKAFLDAMVKDGILEKRGQARGMKYRLTEKAKAEHTSPKEDKAAPKVRGATPLTEEVKDEPDTEKESGEGKPQNQ